MREPSPQNGADQLSVGRAASTGNGSSATAYPESWTPLDLSLGFGLVLALFVGARFTPSSEVVPDEVTVAVVALVPGIAVLWMGRRRANLERVGLSKRPAVGRAVAGWLLFYVANAGYLVVLVVTFIILNPDIERPLSLETKPRPMEWAIFAVLAVGVAPIVEELLFRGLIFRGLAERVGPWIAGVVSAGLFAAVHESLWRVVPIFFVGLLLAWVYWRSQSLWTPIVTHTAINSVGIAILYIWVAAQ